MEKNKSLTNLNGVTIIENNLTEAEEKENLKNIYKTFNKVIENLENKGVDVSKYSYTQKKFNSIKKNPEWIQL